MKPTRNIQHILSKLAPMDEITIEDYPHLPYGKKAVDQHDDYIIIFWDRKTTQIKYTFKGMGHFYFVFTSTIHSEPMGIS